MRSIKNSFLFRFIATALFFVMAMNAPDLFFTPKTSAQSGGGFSGGGGGGGGGYGGKGTVFGGRVQESMECFCRDVITSGKWIKVGQPRPGEFFISHIYSHNYDYKPVNDNEWVLGSSVPISMECKIDTVIYGCVKVKDGDLVLKIGSSMY